MKWYIFDDIKLLKCFGGNGSKALISINDNEVVPDGVLYDEAICQSMDQFGFRIFKLFTEKGVTLNDYEVITSHPEQYDAIISKKKIKVFDGRLRDCDTMYVGSFKGMKPWFHLTPFGLDPGWFRITKEEHISYIKTAEREHKDIVIDGNSIRLVERPVDESYKRMQAICKAKEYLNNTDWVIAKISEIPECRDQYEDVLKKRAEARSLINEMEAE